MSSLIKNAVLCFGLILGMAAATMPAHAALPQTRAVAEAPVLVGGLQYWVGNRTRIVQISLVIVGLGILLLHKK